MPSPTQLIQHTLTVAELLAELEAADPNARVLITCDYGDRPATQQALAISEARSIDDEEWLDETGYSESGVALESADDDDSRWELDDDSDRPAITGPGRGPRDIFLIRC